jgi:hypothetical protein
VYDVLSLSIVWSAELEGICSVASDPHSNHWAIVLKDTKHVLLFEGDNNKPSMGWTIRERQTSAARPPTLNPATSRGAKDVEESRAPDSGSPPEIAFVPRGNSTYISAQMASVPGCSPLVVFSADREFMSVNGTEEYPTSGKVRDQTFDQTALDSSGYARIFGSSAKVDAVVNEASTEYEARDFSREFGDVFPRVSTMCVDFLSGLLRD